jgi:hypothetical protein
VAPLIFFPLGLIFPPLLLVPIVLFIVTTVIFVVHVFIIVLFFFRFSLKQMLLGVIGLNICIACIVSHHALLVDLGIMASIIGGALLFIWIVTFDPQFQDKI